MSEDKSADYAIFACEKDSHTGKTKAYLTVGHLSDPPEPVSPIGGKPSYVMNAAFAKNFFRMLKANLKP